MDLYFCNNIKKKNGLFFWRFLMLKLVDIKKNYIVDKNPTVTALKNINLEFDEEGFVAILGPSGCGKTTLLNIIGGLDQYSSGDLIIDKISTKKFTSSDWDDYRNKKIGIVFQSYNLIPHLSILGNVELSLTLAGVSKKIRQQKAEDALKEVGLLEQKNKKPNQLSGGQMQRVAIARALVNNPHILLCDEPTGALDSKTSIVVMDILKQVSKNHLVIMVTHNEFLAQQYANRIIKLSDGEVVSDEVNEQVETKPEPTLDHTTEIETDDLTRVDNKVINIKKPKRSKSRMTFATSLSLSSRNLMSKKGRTISVSIAGSFGIIGVSLVLALQNGFTNYMDRMETETLTSFPISIEKYTIGDLTDLTNIPSTDYEMYPDDGSLHIVQPTVASLKTNDITSEYIKYVEEMEQNGVTVSSIQKKYALKTVVVTKNDAYDPISGSSKYVTIDTSSSTLLSTYTGSTIWNELPGDEDFVLNQYDVIEGRYPTASNELLITVDAYNRISTATLESLGYNPDDSNLTKLSDLISAKEYKMYKNEDFYSNDAENFKLDPNLSPEEIETLFQSYKAANSSSYAKGLKFNRYADFQDFVTTISAVQSSPNLLTTMDSLLKYFDTKGLEFLDQNMKEVMNQEYLMTSYYAPDDATLDVLWNDSNVDLITGKSLKVVGIVRPKKNVSFPMLGSGVYYTSSLTEEAIGYDSYEDDGNIVHHEGAYEKERLDAMNKNIEAFGETRADGTRNESSDVCDSRFYCENAEYVVSDDLSDNIFLQIDTDKLATGFVNGLMLDPSDPNQAELINLVKTDLENFDFPTLFQDLITYAFDNPYSLKNSIKDGVNMNVVNFCLALFNDSFADGYSVNKLNENLRRATEEQLKAYMNVMAYVFLDNPLSITVYNSVGGVKTTDISSYATLRSNYGTDLDVDSIVIYPTDFDSKKQMMEYLDAWNVGKPESQQIVYTDIAGTATDLVGNIVNVVSTVLIVFAAISLVVSSVMIGIITYVSVIERKKEIGILRSIGARKKDVGVLFIAESSMIGLFAGVIGVVFSLLMEIPINLIINDLYKEVGLGMIANLSPLSCLIMVLLSVFLTFIAGLIPSSIASKKNPVECLRSE